MIVDARLNIPNLNAKDRTIKQNTVSEQIRKTYLVFFINCTVLYSLQCTVLLEQLNINCIVSEPPVQFTVYSTSSTII